MRKNVIYLMGCAAVMILAASCAGRSKDSTAQKTVPEFVLTYAENQAEDYPTTQGAYKFAELVHEQTGGRVEIQVNAGGVLGDEKTVIEQLQFGGVDFARVSLSPLAEFVPKLNVLQMPYLYTGREQEGAELRLLDRGPGVYLSVGFLREDIKWSEGDIRAAV